MAKTVAILGASFAGIPIAHHLLVHTSPLVPDLKVILISPNTHMLWCFASVRGILPNAIEEDKLFIPIAPAFSKYPTDKFEFILGEAEKLDTSTSTVMIRTNKGTQKSISYHTLVIATGSSAREGMPFKTVSNTDKTREILHEWQRQIESAQSIVVAGAGATGVEVAGELAEAYAKTKQKKVTLVASGGLPLDDGLRKDVRLAAQRDLERMGARIIFHAKVDEIKRGTRPGPKTVRLALAGGGTETIEADVVVPAYGVQPNSSFVHESMRDHRGFVKQTKHLRAEGHDNIFVVGDVGSLETPQAAHTEKQVIHVVKSLQAYLRGQDVAEYKFDKEPLIGASIGRRGGIGQAKGWKVPSFLIRFTKADTLGTHKGPDFVAGKRLFGKGQWV